LTWLRRLSRPQRVTVLGAGNVAAMFYMPALSSLRWHALVLDVNLGRARSLARRSGAQAGPASSLEELSFSADDVVVIATPPATHASLVRRALAAGAKRILVEKPPFTSPSDLEAALNAASATDALVGAAFLRRLWPSVALARGQFASWTSAFGLLKHVEIAEGQPWQWMSMSARERGAAGLDPILIEEMPHALDALFHITGWDAPVVQPHSAQIGIYTPWSLSGSVDLLIQDGERVTVRMKGSRSSVLANSIQLHFEDGTAAIEMSPLGGVIVTDTVGKTTVFSCGEEKHGYPELIAQMLRGIADDDSGSGLFVHVADWRGPLSLITALQGAAATDRPTTEREA
jgi:predicted dehydrogenase